MILILSIILQVLGYTVETIPKTGAPPPRASISAAVYDEMNDEIITIGGDYYQSSIRVPKITGFSLKTQTFRKINSFSDIEPKGLSGHGLYLKSNRKIYEFGYSCEFYSFNLENLGWKIEELEGDPLDERGGFGFTSFIHNSSNFVAIFGGLLDVGYSDDLFLIDMDSLISKKIKAGKSTPSPRMASSLVYFEGSLYLFGYAPLKEVPNSDLFRFDLESYEWEKVETLGTPPEPRIQHYAVIFNREMFVLYGMLFEALQEYDSIYKFNFDSRTWIFLSQEIDTRVTVAGSVLVGSKFYLFYGRTTQDVMNSVFSIDLSKNPPQREIVSPDFITPEARIYHCSVVISSFMYTFGGTDANSDDTETFFNDLWQFDFGTLKWSFVNTLGYTPSKRKSFGCAKSLGDVFAIFGGIGPNGLLEDFYYFHETFKTWYQVQPDGLSPSPRRGSCLTYHNYTYFVIGGKNTEKGFNEIWIYSVETNKFVLMEETIFKDGNDIHDAHCWVEDHGSKVEIIVVGGNNFLNIPNPYTVRINVFYQNSTVLVNQSYLNHTDQSPSVVAAGSVLVKGGESLFIVGGVLFDYVMISPIRLKNLKTNEYILYDLPENLNIYGATGVHYQKSFYIFSGGGASDTFRSTYQLTSNIFKISFNSSDDLKLGCSEGHYSEKCKQCSQGTYFDNGICLPCPKGRYSKTLAATSIEQCQPCPAGTFSNKEGSFQCLDCPSGRTCPIGSSEPKLNFELPLNRSAQPNAYENKKSFISYIVANLWFSMSGVAIFLITLCLVFISIWDKIQKFDIFVSQHSNDLGVPVIHRKTKTGGLFSIFFVMASIITIVAGFLNYQLDNVSEIKALIPVISLDSKISAQQTIITSIFYIYGGECIDKDGKCNSNIFYQDSGISYSHRFISCSTFEENCQIKAKYSDLELTLKTAEIQIKLKEKSSYSTAISVNITSSSSIPDQLSGTFTSFTTGSDEALFRGTTASKVFFKLTPSVFFIQLFISESSEWPSEETGFQVSSHQDPERGSLATRSTVNIQIHLLLSIVLLESDTAMKTIRTLNQSGFVFLGALLGSIFGLMGTFSTAMGYSETFIEKLENRIKVHAHVKEIKLRLRILKAEFGKWIVSSSSRKIIPIDTSHSSITITHH